MADIGRQVLFINHEIDTRTDVEGGDKDSFTCHSSTIDFMSKKINRCKVSALASVDVSKYDVICIDEGHFYSDLYETIKKWVFDENKYVLVVGLDGDYKMEPYPEMLRLLPIADNFHKKRASCVRCIKQFEKLGVPKCHNINNAPFTLRKIDSSSKILVGGKDCYDAVCRFHHE